LIILSQLGAGGNLLLMGLSRQVQVGAHISALVIASPQSRVLRFDLCNAFSGQVLALHLNADPRLWTKTCDSTPFFAELPLVAQKLGYGLRFARFPKGFSHWHKSLHGGSSLVRWP